MLGLLVFENKLKEDAWSTIEKLKEAGIESRMITGDNIYIAIETAMRCGILSRSQQVAVIEGATLPNPLPTLQADITFPAKVFRF